METIITKHEFIELSLDEMQIINGGDQFMKDLGHCIGYIFTKIMDAYADSMRYNQTALSSAG